MEELADEALSHRFAFDRAPQPGEIIQRLEPEKRAILKTLKVADIEDTRWTRPDGINLEKMPRSL